MSVAFEFGCVLTEFSCSPIVASQRRNTFHNLHTSEWNFLQFSKAARLSETINSSGSSGRVGGRKTWNLCYHLWRPSFLWLIFTGPREAAIAPLPSPDPLLIKANLAISFTFASTFVRCEHTLSSRRDRCITDDLLQVAASSFPSSWRANPNAILSLLSTQIIE